MQFVVVILCIKNVYNSFQKICEHKKPRTSSAWFLVFTYRERSSFLQIMGYWNEHPMSGESQYRKRSSLLQGNYSR